MEVCYLAANRYHMSVIRKTEQGMVIQPLDHMLLENNSKYSLDEAVEIYNVCQDEKHFVHIVYVNNLNRIIHVILDPQKYRIQKLDLNWDAAGATDLRIQSVSNQLHVILLYGDRIIHRVLSGIHWSEPLTLVSDEKLNSIQLQASKGILYLGFLKKQGKLSEFCLLKHQPNQERWMDLGTIFQTEGIGPLFPLMVLDHQQQLHIVIQQFSPKWLHLSYYMLDPKKKNVQIVEDKKEIPFEQVDSATFAIKEDILLFYCITNKIQYRFSYHLKTRVWGAIKINKMNTYAKWVMVSSIADSGPIAPYFISDSIHLGKLEEQTEYGLHLYRVERDYQQSMEFMDRSLLSVLSLVKQKEQLSAEKIKLLETEVAWRHKIGEVRVRIHNLNEEEKQIQRVLEQKAAEAIHETEIDKEEDLQNNLSDLNSYIIENKRIKQNSMKEKVVHLLHKITGNV